MAYYPGQKVKHTNPRRITLTKILVVIGIALVVYFCVTFVPPYWRYYQAKETIVEAANRGYSTRRQDDEWEEIHAKMHRQLLNALTQHLKVERDVIDLKLDLKKRRIYISAKWTTYAVWPFIGKRTKLTFSEKFDMPAR